jgi:hypothetical protein
MYLTSHSLNLVSAVSQALLGSADYKQSALHKVMNCALYAPNKTSPKATQATAGSKTFQWSRIGRFDPPVSLTAPFLLVRHFRQLLI